LVDFFVPAQHVNSSPAMGDSTRIPRLDPAVLVDVFLNSLCALPLSQLITKSSSSHDFLQSRMDMLPSLHCAPQRLLFFDRYHPGMETKPLAHGGSWAWASAWATSTCVAHAAITPHWYAQRIRILLALQRTTHYT